MDVKRRVLASRLAVRIHKNEEYCREIGLIDHSGFRIDPKGGEQDVSDDSFLIICSGPVL